MQLYVSHANRAFSATCRDHLLRRDGSFKLQKRTEPSLLAAARTGAQWKNSTAMTPPEWSTNVSIACPDGISQTLTILSQLPVASRRPSGEKAAD
jgi:hypothetical protein